MAVRFRRSSSSRSSKGFRGVYSKHNSSSDVFTRKTGNGSNYVINRGTSGSSSDINSQSKDELRERSRSFTLNGSFVSTIFLCVMLFMMLVLIQGSIKHEPMEMFVGVARKVSDYGTGFKGDLEKFSGIVDSIRLDEQTTYTLYWQGHYIEIPKWFVGGTNSLVSVLKFCFIVPFAIGSLALRFLWLLIDLIGYCLL